MNFIRKLFRKNFKIRWNETDDEWDAATDDTVEKEVESEQSIKDEQKAVEGK